MIRAVVSCKCKQLNRGFRSLLYLRVYCSIVLTAPVPDGDCHGGRGSESSIHVMSGGGGEGQNDEGDAKKWGGISRSGTLLP